MLMSFKRASILIVNIMISSMRIPGECQNLLLSLVATPLLMSLHVKAVCTLRACQP